MAPPWGRATGGGLPSLGLLRARRPLRSEISNLRLQRAPAPVRRPRARERAPAAGRAEWCRRNSRHTTHLRDFPAQVRVTRPHHALQGQVLEVFAKLRHKGKPHLLLVLRDGSRSYVPVDWTDFLPSPDRSGAGHFMVASAADLLRLCERVDCLRRRIEPDPTTRQNSPNQESQHAKATTGTVECGAASDSTSLSTANSSTAKRDRRSLGPTHSEDRPGTSRQPLAPNPNPLP